MPAESGPWTGLPQLQPGAGLAPAGVSGANQDGRVSLCLFDSPINTLQSAHPDVQCPPVPPHPRTPPGPLHPQQAKWGGAPAPRHFLLAQARPGSPWPSFTSRWLPGQASFSGAVPAPSPSLTEAHEQPASHQDVHGGPRGPLPRGGLPRWSGLCSAGSRVGAQAQARRGLGTSALGWGGVLQPPPTGKRPSSLGGAPPEISQLLALLHSPRHKHLQEEAPPPSRHPLPGPAEGRPRACRSPPTRLGPGRQTLTHTDAASSSAKAPGPGWAGQMASPPPHAGAPPPGARSPVSVLPARGPRWPAAVQMQSRCPGARGKS